MWAHELDKSWSQKSALSLVNCGTEPLLTHLSLSFLISVSIAWGCFENKNEAMSVQYKDGIIFHYHCHPPQCRRAQLKEVNVENSHQRLRLNEQTCVPFFLNPCV